LFTYVQDFVNNTYTQTPTTGGVVVIDWKIIPRQSSSSTGVSTFVAGPFSSRFAGEQSSNQHHRHLVRRVAPGEQLQPARHHQAEPDHHLPVRTRRLPAPIGGAGADSMLTSETESA